MSIHGAVHRFSIFHPEADELIFYLADHLGGITMGLSDDTHEQGAISAIRTLALHDRIPGPIYTVMLHPVELDAVEHVIQESLVAIEVGVMDPKFSFRLHSILHAVQVARNAD